MWQSQQENSFFSINDESYVRLYISVVLVDEIKGTIWFLWGST